MTKNNKGFTIVELIVSLALLVLILVPVAGFFTNSFKVQAKSSLKTSITRAGQYIVENLKNKNYLYFEDDGNVMIKESLHSENDAGESEYFKTFVEGIEVESDINGIYSFVGTEMLENKEWKITYKGIEYLVDMKIDGFETSNIENSDIPSKSVHDATCFEGCTEHCDAIIEINGDGTLNFFEGKVNTEVSLKTEGTYNSPNDTKDPKTNFVVNYPTIILSSTFPTFEKATLWITNTGYYSEENENNIYNDGVDKQKRIRIVKGFPEELHVYKEGINFSIEKGQEGDMAPASHTKITSSFIGEVSENNTERSASELWLDAKMTITNAEHTDIKDVFEFSFPVDYDYYSE